MYVINIITTFYLCANLKRISGTILHLRSITAHRHEANDGVVFGGEISVSLSDSLLVCITPCVSSLTCITASFNQHSKQCKIYDRIFPDPIVSGLAYTPDIGRIAFRGTDSFFNSIINSIFWIFRN